jgi:hypothetical protein
MRRTGALQGVRMIKFFDVLGRYEATEFSQLEAVELLRVGSARFDGGGHPMRMRAKRVCWTGGLARRRPGSSRVRDSPGCAESVNGHTNPAAAARFRLSWIVLSATPRRRPISRALTPS